VCAEGKEGELLFLMLLLMGIFCVSRCFWRVANPD